MPSTPPFDAEYDTPPSTPSVAAIEAVVTITPRSPSAPTGSRSCIAQAASRTMLKTPMRLMLTMRSNSSSGCGPLRPITFLPAPTPAHAIVMRGAPSCSTRWAKAASKESAEDTSHSAKTPPISDAIAAPRSPSRSSTPTWAPSDARCRAVAAPSPEAPPVMNAVDPAICITSTLSGAAIR